MQSNLSHVSEIKPKLLVVDDQPITVRILHELFRDTCEVFMASSGEQAINKCMSVLPDLILLDVVMQGMDGYETCRRLKANSVTAHIPIIFVTGQLEEAEEVKGFEIGAVDFIRKPINPIVTRVRVNTHLKLKSQADLLRSFALIDGLTGIANRRSFETQLEANWLQSIRAREPVSLVLLDVDFFKQYNDNYGHQQGDECLKQIAHTLSAVLNRPYDLAARFGGEEFVLIMPQTHHQGAEKVALAALEKVEALAIPHSASPTGIVSLSAGLATTIPIHQTPANLLIEMADQALYSAKKSGRNKLGLNQFACKEFKKNS